MLTKIRLQNGFVDKFHLGRYLLACNLLEGEIDEKDWIIYNSFRVCQIYTIEKMKVSEDIIYILGVTNLDDQNVIISELYNKVLHLEKESE